MEKLIITAAICGAEVTKEQNPNVPYTVEEKDGGGYTVAYNYGHYFLYDRETGECRVAGNRPGTLAAGFPNQIMRTVKTSRARKLSEAAVAARQKFAAKICFSMPWSENSLREFLLGENGFGLVLLCDGRFAAYAGVIMPYRDEADLANVATLPQYRRHGFARMLIKRLLPSHTYYSS